MQSHPPPYLHAARAFRHFFNELRDVYLERETLFTQLELALLSREHVLVVGPPGTAKSAIASAVLGRIIDEQTGLPSLFSKQLAESTVQTDLLGPVDFKVLTETGRTEYLTDEGMLGSQHAFLDEIFDGRDMLLRSILNVLFERELKHGRRVTTGRTECVVMTSNRYLSEVLARSPELLLAFADRLSFISFVPKSFARKESRAAMLQRFAHGARADLRAPLSVQQLDLLQDAVARVKVPGPVLEGVEMLADGVERALTAQVSKLPDYVPTKYFSQRSVVKALWALKAAVVRDQIYRRPERPLEASVEDLDALRWFFLLGGPPSAETDALLKSVVDPRERAQLEIVRLEQRTFDEVITKVRQELGGSQEREAHELGITDEAAVVDALSRNWQPSLASTSARGLMAKLVPGPRHSQNRAPLLGVARGLVAAMDQRLARGMAGQTEGRSGLSLLASFHEVLDLCRVIPELKPGFVPLSEAIARFLETAVEMIALSAESADFDDALKLEGLVGLADNLEEELSRSADLVGLLVEGAPASVDRLRTAEAAVRKRVVGAVRRRATVAFQGATPKGRKEPLETLAADSRRLSQLEQSLMALDPTQPSFKQELLLPLGLSYAREVLSSTPFERIDQYGRAVQAVAENLRREGLPVDVVMGECHGIIDGRLQEHARRLGREEVGPPPATASVFSGDAYLFYRGTLATKTPDGELAALQGLEGQLAFARAQSAATFFSEEARAAVAQVELTFLQARVKYLRGWLTQLLTALPAPESLTERAEVERTVDRLVRSRFPLLALKEGELVRLRGVVALVAATPGEVGANAQRLESQLHGIEEDFGRYSRQVLERRSAA
ncbi:MoxR family ATPase [Myxococcus stipitatus]|uniref:AAA family ATPase n=1 Tax=Myxococcus stipitatus TaxID=83455 RepID=UPI003145510E